MIQTFTPNDRATMTSDERLTLFGLAAGCRHVGTHFIEIGTWQGANTSNLARLLPFHHGITVSMPSNTFPALESTPSDADYFGVTPFFDDDVKDRITHIFSDSALVEFPNTLQVGFAFIDGGHSEAYVKNDFAKVQPHCVPGSIIVFHDYGTDSLRGITKVRLAVDWLAEQWPTLDWVAFPENNLAWVYL